MISVLEKPKSWIIEENGWNVAKQAFEMGATVYKLGFSKRNYSSIDYFLYKLKDVPLTMNVPHSAISGYRTRPRKKYLESSLYPGIRILEMFVIDEKTIEECKRRQLEMQQKAFGAIKSVVVKTPLKYKKREGYRI